MFWNMVTTKQNARPRHDPFPMPIDFRRLRNNERPSEYYYDAAVQQDDEFKGKDSDVSSEMSDDEDLRPVSKKQKKGENDGKEDVPISNVDSSNNDTLGDKAKHEVNAMEESDTNNSMVNGDDKNNNKNENNGMNKQMQVQSTSDSPNNTQKENEDEESNKNVLVDNSIMNKDKTETKKGENDGKEDVPLGDFPIGKIEN